jgi:hypothetical protein
LWALRSNCRQYVAALHGKPALRTAVQLTRGNMSNANDRDGTCGHILRKMSSLNCRKRLDSVKVNVFTYLSIF